MASSAWVTTGVAITTASTSGSSRSSSKRSVNGRWPETRPRARRSGSLSRSQSHFRRASSRSCGRGSSPRGQGRPGPRSPVRAQSFHTGRSPAASGPVALRKSTTRRGLLREALVVDAGVGGHDRHAVGRSGRLVELDRGQPVLAAARGRAGRCSRRAAPPRWRSSISFNAGDSRTSPTFALVGHADEVHAASLQRALLRVERPARSSLKQKYGMFSLTLPASSMNSV